MNISIVGVGNMGGAIGSRLSGVGYDVTGYNRTVKQNHLKLPFTVSQSYHVLDDSDVVILSLFDEKSVTEVLISDDSAMRTMRPGTIVIDTTTHNPEFAKTISSVLSKKRIAYFDAPVSGGVEKAANGELAIMVGGNHDLYGNITSLLSQIGSHVYFLGDTGSGQAAKLVNQVLVGISQIAIAEALTLANSLGVNGNNLLEVLKYSAGDSKMMRRSAPQMMDRNYSSEFQSYLIAKDLDEVLKEISKKSVDLPLVSYSKKILELHSEGEYRNADAASIFEQYLNVRK